MKKILVLLGLLLIGLGANAEVMVFESNLTMDNIWDKTGKYEKKIIDIGQKILYANKIDKRVPFVVSRTKVINATSASWDKTVTIYLGLMRYMENDDEMAGVIAHEIVHSLDSYGGPMKWMAMSFNSSQYELKADTMAVDMMVKAGYNPVAIITGDNKWMGEAQWDFGLFTSHPKTSKRLFEVYKYIYKKYPQYLNSQMTKSPSYQLFLISAEKDIKAFHQKEKERAYKRGFNE